MRFTTPDGEEFVGRSYDDIVEQMAGEKLTPPESIETYRTATANRVRGLVGEDINTDSNSAFVKALEAAGLLERSS